MTYVCACCLVIFLQITAVDKKRTNLLHAACEMGHGDLAGVLIERYNMGVEDEDRKGLTPLARAAKRNEVRQKKERGREVARERGGGGGGKGGEGGEGRRRGARKSLPTLQNTKMIFLDRHIIRERRL